MSVVPVSRIFTSLGLSLNAVQRVGAVVITGLLLTTGFLGVVAPAARADSITATITGFNGPIAVAVNPAGTLAYFANVGNSSALSVVNLNTNTITGTITVPSSRYGLAVNPAGTLIYVTNYGAGTVSVVDLSTNAVTATITGFSSPTGIALNPAGTLAYVSNYSNNTLSVVDLSTNAVTATLTGFNGPYGVAVNPAGTFAYVANYGVGTVSVVNLNTNTITATLTGFSEPSGVAVNPAGTLAYVSNIYNNTVSVVALDQPASGSAVIPAVPDKMQAVPRPSTGCATFVSDTSINWSGIAGTGWNPSWAQWANGGLGGDVCVRMLGYNMNTSSWFIR